MTGTELKRTLSEDVLYPPHAPRTESPEYKAIHKKMVVDEDRPCLVCGVRNSDLKDPKRRDDPAINPYGAKAIETHHRLIEWALAGAVDLAKFNARILPGLLHHTGDTTTFGHDFTQEEMEAFVDHGEQNLWPICDKHHRSPRIGIHAITGPIWGVQDVLKDGYNLTNFVATSPHEAAALTALPQTTGQAQPPEQPEPTPAHD